MKPKDLKSHFTWDERKPYIEKGVLYVPPYYFDHESFEMPSFFNIFSNQNPLFVEYCSGNGDWIVQKALENPDKNWIAVEMLFERVRKIYSKRENREVKNLLIVCGEAQTFSKHYLKENAIDGAFVNFPDPWPKARHAKHRLLKEDFIALLSEKMKNQSHLKVVTDDRAYCELFVELMLPLKNWRSTYENPYFKENLEGYGFSFFCDLWRKKGKSIHHIEFINQK